MNHDDKDKNPDLNLWIDPELEARVIAWVLGEVSDFEATELERLIEEKPELALFKKRIEEAHELAAEAMCKETGELRLSPERRAELLARISEPTAKTEPEKPTVYRRSMAINWRKWVPAGAVTVAASFILVFGVIRMGLRHSVFSSADFSQSLELPSPPPPAEWDGRRSGSEETSMRQMEPGSKLLLGSPTVDPLILNEMEIALDAGVGGMSGTKDDLNRQFGQDKRAMTAAVDTSISYKSEGSVSEEVSYEFGDLDRLNANKPAAAGRSDAVFQVGDAPAPTSGRRERAKETDGDAIVTLSAFMVSDVQGDSGYRAQGGAPVSRPESRDAGEAQSLFDAVDEKKAQTAGSSVVGKKLKNHIEVIKTSQERAEIPFTAFETNALEEPVSTFSLHVSDVSFRLALAALDRGEIVNPETIRAEEFYNAFDYGDLAPTAAEKIACRIDQAAHPVLQQRNFVRIAMKVPAIGRGAGQPLRLTVLLDTSGSMEREDRRESLQAAVTVLASLLGPDDRVTVIGFARRQRLLVEAMPGDRAHQLADIIAHTPSEGGTNLEEALGLSVQLARRHFDPDAQNRIVLITDGAANLGNADPEMLAATVEKVRQQGIAFDACGVGADGMNDAILEALTRKGDGRYYILDRPEDADENFADQLAGAFRPAAENVKVQVRFNPARVGNYRLIGFEKHRLSEEDFRNDAVDAAELAAEEAAVALYQVEVLPEGEGELGEVYVRFRDASTGEMVERSWTAPFNPHARAFDQASPAVQLAGTAAILAEILRKVPMAEQVQLDELAPVVTRLRGHYADEANVQGLVRMYQELRKLENTGSN